MTDVVALTERLCRVRTPNPGGDEHALAVLLAEELRARRADEWVAEADLHAAQALYAGVYRACGRAAER